jgi:hypothetical protein
MSRNKGCKDICTGGCSGLVTSLKSKCDETPGMQTDPMTEIMIIITRETELLSSQASDQQVTKTKLEKVKEYGTESQRAWVLVLDLFYSYSFGLITV